MTDVKKLVRENKREKGVMHGSHGWFDSID